MIKKKIMQQIRLEFNSFSDTQFQTEYPERRILLLVKKTELSRLLA